MTQKEAIERDLTELLKVPEDEWWELVGGNPNVIKSRNIGDGTSMIFTMQVCLWGSHIYHSDEYGS